MHRTLIVLFAAVGAPAAADELSARFLNSVMESHADAPSLERATPPVESRAGDGASMTPDATFDLGPLDAQFKLDDIDSYDVERASQTGP